MVETTTLELSVHELKVLITALHSFERSLKKKSTRSDILLNIYHAERQFNFDYDLEALISNPLKFLDETIGLQFDKLTDAFYDLAEKTGTAKPLPPEDDRFSFKELAMFCELDLRATTEGF